jgi:carbamoyltransferase
MKTKTTIITTNFLIDTNPYIKMTNISFYGSHNAAYVVEENGKIVLVLEVERFLNSKNSGMAQYLVPKVPDLLFLAQYIPQYIMSTLGIKEFDNCYYLNTDVILDKSHSLEKYIPAKEYKGGNHHRSHAAGTFYQSPYEEALIFSFDGGGDDGKFNIYYGTRENSVKLLEGINNPILDNPHIKYDLGFPYMIFGQYLDDIKLEPLNIGNLVYPGKIMGLASYGNVNQEWLPYFVEFYKNNPDGSRYGEWDDTGYYDYEFKLKKLGKKINLKFDVNDRFLGQVAYDIAATSQRAFEDCFLEIAEPYFDLFPDTPICITGGCGLNIILNTRLVEEFNKEVFVGPNPNDCGIALGLMLDNLKPQEPIDITYSGTELLDINLLSNYIQNQPFNFTSHILDTNTLIEDLVEGKIVGVARGKAEHGPRALGNRSIICNPIYPEMKDILNAKVKHREWYRPFAPVVRLEDVNKYFEWNKESRWMSFCPKVREEWKNKLGAITHVDGTARVQTVTKEQNEWLYNLLTEFENRTGVGVLLNTSFNVDGKPILSTIEDAFKILRETEMDGLIIENVYIKK